MSLYSEYILERESYKCVEDDNSFFTYKKIGNSLYLRDMYITPKKRRVGKARAIVKIVERLARELKCNKVLTTVDKTTNNWEINKVGILSAGFEILNEDDVIYFVKEI